MQFLPIISYIKIASSRNNTIKALTLDNNQIHISEK